MTKPLSAEAFETEQSQSGSPDFGMRGVSPLIPTLPDALDDSFSSTVSFLLFPHTIMWGLTSVKSEMHRNQVTCPVPTARSCRTGSQARPGTSEPSAPTFPILSCEGSIQGRWDTAATTRKQPDIELEERASGVSHTWAPIPTQ